MSCVVTRDHSARRKASAFRGSGKVGIARVWLDESFASAPVDLAAEALSLAIMTSGIIALAHRAPRVVKEVAAVSPPARQRSRN
jgi:hypothetical protein